MAAMTFDAGMQRVCDPQYPSETTVLSRVAVRRPAAPPLHVAR